MIIECFSGGVVRLAEPFDFHRFKLALHADVGPEAESWNGIKILDDHDALVSIDLAPALAGHPDDTSWHQQYAKMLATAREHGWIDLELDAIRAHIERVL